MRKPAVHLLNVIVVLGTLSIAGATSTYAREAQSVQTATDIRMDDAAGQAKAILLRYPKLPDTQQRHLRDRAAAPPLVPRQATPRTGTSSAKVLYLGDPKSVDGSDREWFTEGLGIAVDGVYNTVVTGLIKVAGVPRPRSVRYSSVGNGIETGRLEFAGEYSDIAMTRGSRGFVAVGTASKPNGGPDYIFYHRLNDAGEPAGAPKPIPSRGRSEAKGVVIHSDGSFTVVGEEYATDKGFPIYTRVVRIDRNDHVLWDLLYQKCLYVSARDGSCVSASENHIVKGVKEVPGSDDVMVFGSYEMSSAGYTGWLLKIDATGLALWDKSFDPLRTEIKDIAWMIDKGLIVTGVERDGDLFVIRLRPTGTLQWHRICGGTADDRGTGIAVVAGNGLIVVGTTQSKSKTMERDSEVAWILKLDDDGFLEWEKGLASGQTPRRVVVRGLELVVLMSRWSQIDRFDLKSEAAAFPPELNWRGPHTWTRDAPATVISGRAGPFSRGGGPFDEVALTCMDTNKMGADSVLKGDSPLADRRLLEKKK